MAEDFVSRAEFNNLKEEVSTIKHERLEDFKLLQQIDKKTDVIYEKLSNADKIDELKLSPIEKRVAELEDAQKWLRRTVIATIIGEIITIIGAIIIFILKSI